MQLDDIKITQLKRVVRSTQFLANYLSLLLGRREELSSENLQRLLTTAVVFLNAGDESVQKLGYRIILRYSIVYNNYAPLFDVAINKGFIPVSKLLEQKYLTEKINGDSFFANYFSAYQDNYLKDDLYLSYGQKQLIHISNNSRNNLAIVAPTSYGKSELIINKIEDNLGGRICVIVPSKALLAQTKRRILNSRRAEQIGRIVTHSEMYRGDETKFVAVLTQERLLRLLQKNPDLNFSFVLVDEAHNLFKDDNRAALLAQVIMILIKRKSDTILNFFSPFISDHFHLRIPHVDYSLEGVYTKESIKVERYFLVDIFGDKKLYLYDQFVNSFEAYSSLEYTNDIEVIDRHKSPKNIIYLNRQKDIQKFSLELASRYLNENDAVFQEIMTTIADFLHPDYDLIKCISAGIVYHHGGMPEIIRLYVESVFTQSPLLKFIVTSSTLLEGVNIPAEKIFLLTTKIGRRNFSKSQFKNLIGRVCRFSEIFDRNSGRVEMLEPEIYIIKSQYESERANLRNFLESTARTDLKLSDDVDNLLLKNESELVDQEDKIAVREKLEYLENIEPNTVSVEGMVYVTTEIGKLCYRNNVYDFDIRSSEQRLNENLAQLESVENITDVNTLIEVIFGVFINGIDITNDSIKRLGNPAARRFYAMVLDWRSTGTSYKEMIAKFMNYWNSIQDKVIYFGTAWGEMRRSEGGFLNAYINLATKSNRERINLAIIKIKEEQDFVEFNLLKYIEILSELGKIGGDFYDRIKYGSSDPIIISLLKNGFSIELAKIMAEKYSQYFIINPLDDDLVINSSIRRVMLNNGENKILVFEINYHIRVSQENSSTDN